MFVQLNIDHGERRRCQECGRVRPFRWFEIDLGSPDFRALRCLDCAEADADPFTLKSVW
ncbi:hypothetical protein IGX29_07855 [Streptomyces sp. H28]|uniref:hypothetical protein n=1 Tax=Streptomyces sp. H28 TaxID=2775865 RepID=UPI001780A99B|nr:hypothetical protein [Streptomyces sp. H28]MBD9731734.1 hypothetical protein [Streptomyces sp. H28]